MAGACASPGLVATFTPSKTAAHTTTPPSTMLPSRIPNHLSAPERGLPAHPRLSRPAYNDAIFECARSKTARSGVNAPERRRLTLIRHGNAEQDPTGATSNGFSSRKCHEAKHGRAVSGARND